MRKAKSEVRIREVPANFTPGEEMPGFVESVETADAEFRAAAR